ncbi:ER membrane protein [Colletotrichum kahawae]|uniref:ER membrane protein n=1 Tax=Colletotrichum kahawae TaxID=34407 RepID=A0AAD9YC63_COLKA|nr:ER membrane protein [Colletotrichum kahawae]
MADFVVNLWASIFTPGPTPTLLVATNATFAALQVLLLVLLVSTYSIHFAILSFISGGLWYSINWFAREVARNAEQEDIKKALGADTAAPAATDDSDTEVEGAASGRRRRVARPRVAGSTSQAETEEQRQEAELKRRVAAATESGIESNNAEGTQSSVSTEDEWEKVSEAENEKDK